MNLVQIQNRLKEMPTQVVMGYANGSNPQVPPYLALGELNRRKQMEQESKSAEAPQQSVKDQIEQQVKLMQTMAGRQQEAMQQQNQMLGQQSMIAPKSTPVTDAEAFAAGGVARLPTELRFNRGGGIVAFASPSEENNYSLVRDPMLGTIEDTSPGGDDRTIWEKLGIFNPENRRALERIERGQPASGEKPSAPAEKTEQAKPEEKPEPKEMSTAEKVALLMGNRGGGGGGGGGARPAAGGDIYSMMSKALGASKFEEGPDYEKFMEQQKAKNKYLQGLPGEKYESLLEEIRRQDLADRERFKQQEQNRQGRRLMDVLMGAGAGMGKFAPKAQTGGAGILNLLGGIGQQSGAMREADIQRTKEQSALERQQNLAYAEMLSKIEDVRRAEARGDAKAIFDAKQDAAKAKREFEKSQLDALYKGSTVEEQRRHGMAVEGIQRLQASQAGRDLIRERAALLASLPENKNKSMTELLQMAAGLPQGAQFESAEVRRLREAEAAWEKGKMERMQQGIKPGSPEEAAKRKEHDKKWGIAPGSTGGGSSSRIQVLGKE